MIASFPDRRFQLWEYSVSHGSLLVRSPRGPRIDTNIDLVFVGVAFISAPRHLRGLELDHGNDDDIDRVVAEVGEIDGGHVFALRSAGRRHLVLAAACRVSENQGDIFDSPFE
jgi:hypothetical protein